MGQSVKLKLGSDQKTAVLLSSGDALPPNEAVPAKLMQMLLRSGFSLSGPDAEELMKTARNLDPMQKRLYLLLNRRLRTRQEQPLEYLLAKIKTSKDDQTDGGVKEEFPLDGRGLKDFFLQNRDHDGALTVFNHIANDAGDHWVVVPFEFGSAGKSAKGLFKLNFDLLKGFLKQAVIQLHKDKDSFFVLKMKGRQAVECRFYPADAEEAAAFKKAGFPRELAEKFKTIAFHMREERAVGFDGFDDEDLKSVDHRI
jgi:hypothetical protein